MNLLFRLLWLVWRSRGSERVDMADEVVLGLRVLPNDLDVLGHMNNGRYLSIMDLGRTAFMLRTGIWHLARRRGWLPLVRQVSIAYYHTLRPFRRFTLRTRLLGWDDKWFYIEQRFVRGDRLCACAHVQGLLRGPHGNVAPRDVLAAMGEPEREPPSSPPELTDLDDPEPLAPSHR